MSEEEYSLPQKLLITDHIKSDRSMYWIEKLYCVKMSCGIVHQTNKKSIFKNWFSRVNYIFYTKFNQSHFRTATPKFTLLVGHLEYPPESEVALHMLMDIGSRYPNLFEQNALSKHPLPLSLFEESFLV
jgi:hypothetical protein